MHHPAAYILGLLFIGGAILAIGSVLIPIMRATSIQANSFDARDAAEDADGLLEDAAASPEPVASPAVPARLASEAPPLELTNKIVAREKRSLRAKRKNGGRVRSGKRDQMKRPRSKRRLQSQ